VLGQAWILIVVNAFAKDLLKIVQPLPYIRRHWITARSQKKHNRLWRPPPMRIGDLYASTLKTVALSLAYGPIYPMAYLWSIFAFFFCWMCTRFGISRWFKKPPAVDESMMSWFCSLVATVMFLQIAVQAAGCYAQATPLVDGIAVYVLAPLAWLAYMLTCFGERALIGRYFRAFRARSPENLELDTDGIGYYDVRRLKRTELEAYVCPKLTLDLVNAAAEELAKQMRVQEELMKILGDEVYEAALRKAKTVGHGTGSSGGGGGSLADWISNLVDS
jgi:hypothetical protein